MNGANVSWGEPEPSLTAIRAEWPDREGAVDRRGAKEVLRRVESVILEFDMPSYRTGVAQQRGF